MFIQILIGLLQFCITIQLGYMLCLFAESFKPAESKLPLTDKKPVSIIICAKNEAANLEQNLPAILAQRYSNEAGNVLYEVIVVNDGSTDHTGAVLDALIKQHVHLWVVNIPAAEERTFPGKKYALGKGVFHASHAFLLLTDADCRPASDSWLEEMVKPLHEGKEIVAGYGAYRYAPGLLNAFIRWETLHTFFQYSSYALAGIPYMAVGRNMACTKAAFEKARQSEAWAKLPSGDDDLLVNAVADANNMAIVSDPTAFTISAAKSTWADWIKQKQRHLSTGKYYKPKTKILLGLYAMSHALVWLSFLILIFTPSYRPALLAMGFRCFAYWGAWLFQAGRLKVKKLVLWFPLFDLGWMIYNFAFLPYISWKNKKQWK